MTNIEPTPRDPAGTGPRAHPTLAIILGALAATFFVLGVISALLPSGTQTVTNVPATTPPATQTR